MVSLAWMGMMDGAITTKNGRRVMSKPKAFWFVVPSVLFLSACAIATPGYTKEGASEAQQKLDAYECERDAYMMTRTSDRERKRMYRQCMESRGYKS